MVSHSSVTIRTHKGTGERRVTREDLERVVHLCQQDAAHELNIGVTRFKTACRQLGFSSWPYRRIKSIRALKQTIQESGDLDPETAQIIVDELDAVEKELLQHPDRPLDEDFKRLRQAAYKKTHGQRRDPDDAFVDETEY